MSPQRTGRHVSGQQPLLFPPLGPEAARTVTFLIGRLPPLTAGTRSEQSRREDPIKPPGMMDSVSQDKQTCRRDGQPAGEARAGAGVGTIRRGQRLGLAQSTAGRGRRHPMGLL